MLCIYMIKWQVTRWTKGFGSDETYAYRHRSKSMEVQWDGKGYGCINVPPTKTNVN